MSDLNVIPAFYVANLLDFAVQGKSQQQDILSLSGLATADSSQLISLPALTRLIENICRYNPSPSLGVEFGRHLSPISHGILSQAAISSNTLQDIANLIGKYTVLRTSLVDVTFVEGTCTSGIRVAACIDSNVMQNFLVDIAISCIVSVFEFVTEGGFKSSKILLARDMPGHREERRFSQHSTPAVEYKQDRNSIVFPTSQLAIHCRFSDKDTFNEVVLKCESELTQLSASKALHEQVKELLEKDIIKFSVCSNTADFFNITTRTLRRRLEKQGQSYQVIVDEVRQGRAEYLLLSTAFSVAQIAEALGFNDASSFGKAFRKKCGCSPSQFRRPAR